jgi:hypothetical protein
MDRFSAHNFEDFVKQTQTSFQQVHDQPQLGVDWHRTLGVGALRARERRVSYLQQTILWFGEKSVISVDHSMV